MRKEVTVKGLLGYRVMVTVCSCSVSLAILFCSSSFSVAVSDTFDDLAVAIRKGNQDAIAERTSAAITDDAMTSHFIRFRIKQLVDTSASDDLSVKSIVDVATGVLMGKLMYSDCSVIDRDLLGLFGLAGNAFNETINHRLELLLCTSLLDDRPFRDNDSRGLNDSDKWAKVKAGWHTLLDENASDSAAKLRWRHLRQHRVNLDLEAGPTLANAESLLRGLKSSKVYVRYATFQIVATHFMRWGDPRWEYDYEWPATRAEASADEFYGFALKTWRR